MPTFQWFSGLVLELGWESVPASGPETEPVPESGQESGPTT